MASVLENTEDFLHNLKLCVKSLFDNSCKNALGKYNSQFLLKNLLMSYYSYFIEKLQMKFVFYQLNEAKLKKHAELNDNHEPSTSVELEKEIEKNRQIILIKELANSLVLECSTRAISHYQTFICNVENKVVLIQRSFRRSLTRLINKMEFMNYKLQIEEQQAIQRKRNKTINK